ncbi:MAG: hypothetical protein Kow00107_03390 [Planctomycetota bacterium]
MAETPKEIERSMNQLREDIESLRREVLDVRDATVAPVRKSSSHLAVQSTLAIIAIVVLIFTAVLVVINSGSIDKLADAQRSLLEEMEQDAKELAEKYAQAVLDLRSAENARNELARELASTRQELSEIRLENMSGKLDDDREAAKLRERLSTLQEKYSALEREISRSDAQAEQLRAFKEETESKIDEYRKKIKVLEERILQLESRPVAPSLTPTPVTAITPRSSETTSRPTATPIPNATEIIKSRASAIDDL